MTGVVQKQCAHEKVSIVIATLGRRVEMTRRMLQALGRQSCRNFEVILVLNGKGSPELERMLREFPVQLLKTPVLGQSHGQNFGIRASDGALLIPTDDDVIPNDDWIHQLVSPFTDEKIGCVTGRFEMGNEGFFRNDRVHSERALSSWTISPSDPDWVDAVLRGDTGIAANNAFRREALMAGGLMPEDINGGTAIDTVEGDVYLKILKNGYSLHHNPNAVVTLYFDEPLELQKQRLYGTYSAAVALYIRLWVQHRGLRWRIAKSFLSSTARVARRRPETPQPGQVRLSMLERLRAYSYGVILYARSRRDKTRTHSRAEGS